MNAARSGETGDEQGGGRGSNAVMLYFTALLHPITKLNKNQKKTVRYIKKCSGT